MAGSFLSLFCGGTGADLHACRQLRGTCLLQMSRGIGTVPVYPSPRATSWTVSFLSSGLPSWRSFGLMAPVVGTS